MTREEQIKIDDFKEQYRSILGSIRVATRELEEVFARRNLLKNECVELGVTLNNMSEVLETLYQEESSVYLQINSRLRAIERKEEEFEEVKGVKLSRLLNKEDLSTQIEASKRAEIVSLKHDIHVLSLYKSELLKEVIELGDKEETASVRYSNLQEEKISLSEENEKDETFAKWQKREKKKLLIEIQAVLATLDSKKSSYEEITKGLKEREKAVTNRERNCQILVNRIRNAYQVKWPGIPVKI